MSCPCRAWPVLLAALAAPLAWAQSGWKTSGSGTDTTLTLEAQAAPIGTLRAASRTQLTLKCHERKPMVGLLIGPLDRSSATVRFDREPAFEADLRPRTKWGKLWMTTTVIDPDTKFFDKPGEIAAALLAHSSMLVKVTPSNSPSREVTFDLQGLLPQLAAFEAACDLERPIERPSAVAAPAASAPVATAAAKPVFGRFGEWAQSITRSKIDDRPIVLISLQQAKASTASRSASLVFRCRENTTEAFLSYGFGLGSKRAYLAVRPSTDGSPEGKEWWLAPSTDGVVYFFDSAPKLLKRLLASRELRLAYRPKKRPENYAWMPQGEAVFALTGLDEAAKAYLDACPIDLAKLKLKDGLPPIP